MRKSNSTNSDLDGGILVNAVLVVEVDAVNAEPREAALACRPHVRWVTVELPGGRSLTPPCSACFITQRIRAMVIGDWQQARSQGTRQMAIVRTYEYISSL